ncbi:hypothetical protein CAUPRSCDRAFT_7053, partial [Caulochytrium protostelioides]
MPRHVIGVNGTWPMPPITVHRGDTLHLELHNHLSVPTALHAHGIFQNGTAQMDGVPFITQCPIPTNHSFTYIYELTSAGTYWVHAHFKGQYVDGMRTSLVVLPSHEDWIDPSYLRDVDRDELISLTDWYPIAHCELLKRYLSFTNPTGAEPVPSGGLINHHPRPRFYYEPDQIYRLRLVNMAAFATFHVSMDDHVLYIVEVDGVTVHPPYPVTTFPIAASQRVSVLVHTKPTRNANYRLRAYMDVAMFDVQLPEYLAAYKLTADILYDPARHAESYASDEAAHRFQDGWLTPFAPDPSGAADVRPTHVQPDHTLSLDVDFAIMSDQLNHGLFNDRSFAYPTGVPALNTATSANATAPNARALLSHPELYGLASHPILLPHLHLIEVGISNQDANAHPFHLHGHVFSVVAKS